MSALTVSPTTSGRPTTITAASTLLALLGVLAVPTMVILAAGFDAVFFSIGGTLAVLKLIAAVGLWRCRRWAAIFGFVATLLDVLLTLPGFVDGTVADGKALMAVGVVIGVAALVLIVLPTSRRAYA